MEVERLPTRVVVRVFLTVVGLSALLYVLWRVRAVVGLLCIAVFLSVALGPAVDSVQRLRLPRAASILLVFLFLFLSVFTVASLVVPPIVDQVENAVDGVPAFVEGLRANERLREFDDEYDVTQRLQAQAETLPSRLTAAAGALRSLTVDVLSGFVQLITVLTITFFLLIDGRRVTEFLYDQIPVGREARVRQVTGDIYRSVGGYVLGALTLGLSCGISTYLMLTVLGVPFAVPLAVLMAFLGLIPLVGATIGGTLILVVTLFQDFPTDAIAWAVFVLVYQQFENTVLQPKIYRRTVDLHPLVMITGILVGSSLLGVLGALLAIPVAAAVQIVAKDLWAHRLRSRLVLDAASEPLGGAPPPGAGSVVLPSGASAGELHRP